nr:STAS domain-containing protein [Rugamonas sp. CCM 8940]
MFSLFKKNPRPPAAPGNGADADAGARPAAAGETLRQNSQALQRDIARATAMKIDAIESAMELDIFADAEPAWRGRPRQAGASVVGDGATLPLLGQHSTELLGEAELPATPPHSAPVVEESAILYANGQAALAEQMLRASLAEQAGAEPGRRDRTVWWLLFDLYQLSGQQERFDDLSIDYASVFETSPPSWRAGAAGAAAAWAGVAPGAVLGGPLDARLAPQLERLAALARGGGPLRLELGGLDAVAPAGCALLLPALHALQAGGRELVVTGAAELAGRIRAALQVGRRDDGAAAWLLLLELLQLLGREKDFEECAMDYCVTFEVSPPSYVAAPKVATAAPQPSAAAAQRFVLPALVDGDAAALLRAVRDHAAGRGGLVFDCSRLARIEFGAAHQLVAALQALAADGKKLELRDLNHPVAALLRLLGCADIAKIYPHRY